VNTAQGTSIEIWKSIKYAPNSLMNKFNLKQKKINNNKYIIKLFIIKKKKKKKKLKENIKR
jgi:hypothetical protein